MEQVFRLNKAMPMPLLWRKSFATMIYAGTNALIINLADPAHVLYSVDWFKHVLLGTLITIIVFEARFWRTWADSILNSNGNGTNPTSNGANQ